MRPDSHPRQMKPGPVDRGSERGFTLIETLIAMIVLIFGLVAISHLMLVATSSNAVANRGTVAATLASQQLEQLARVPFNSLVEGGDLDVECTSSNTFCREDELGGAGNFETTWQMSRIGNLMYIRVRTQARRRTPMAGLTRAEFTLLRASNAPPAGAATASPTP